MLRKAIALPVHVHIRERGRELFTQLRPDQRNLPELRRPCTADRGRRTEMAEQCRRQSRSEVRNEVEGEQIAQLSSRLRHSAGSPLADRLLTDHIGRRTATLGGPKRGK